MPNRQGGVGQFCGKYILRYWSCALWLSLGGLCGENELADSQAQRI